MALMLTPSGSSSANAVPTQLLEDALKDFESVLSGSQRQELHQKSSPPDADAVIVFTAELDARNMNRKGRSVASNLFSVLQSVRDFSTIVGTFISAHPEIAALVWGSVQLTTFVLTNFLSYYEAASKFFIDLGRLCPRFTEYQGLYPASMGLKTALCDFHASIIRFCKHLVEALQRRWVQQALHSLWGSFEQEFGSDKDEIRTLSKNVKYEIELARTKAELRDRKLQEEDRRQAEESRSFLSRFVRRTDDNMGAIKHQQIQREEQRALERRQHLLDELSTHDYLTPLKQSRRQRHPGTTEWIFQTAEYKKWFDGTGPPLLWCTGKIGSGKTVLSASVVDRILIDKKTPQILVAFYFLRFDEQQSLLADTAARSILRQLLIPENVAGDQETKLREALHPGAAPTQLLEVLCARIKQLERCFIIIDGIDEFEKKERHHLFGVLHEIVSQASNTRLFLAGRESYSEEIRSTFPSLQYISMGNPSLRSDMELYIHSQIQQRIDSEELVVANQKLISDIKMALLNGVDGMFLWIAFLVDEVCSQHCDEDIRSAICDLPRDLTEVFNRALRRIVSRRNAKVAQKAFRWIGGMARPPHIDELSEIIFVEVCQQHMISGRKCNDIQRIASWCENLVVVDEELQVVQFAHHSIRTFLLQKPDASSLQPFHFKLEDATHYIGEICVTYLNFNDFKTELARKTKLLRSIDPAEIPGKIFGSRANIMLKKTARPHSAAVAESISLTNSSFAQSRTGTDSDRLDLRYPFLAYAKENWAFHTSHFQRRRSQTWNLLKRMVLSGHQLAGSPWDSDTTMFEWAISHRHLALLSIVMSTRTLSDAEQQSLGKLADTGDEVPLGTILNEQVFFDPLALLLLTAAIESRNEDLFSKLLAVGVVDALSADSKYKALQSVAEHGHGITANKLLRAGVDVNALSAGNKLTALETAMISNNADVAYVFIAAGADVNAPSSNQYGGTLLQYAAEKGDGDMVDRLLAAGADVNAPPSKYGLRALQYAVEQGNKHIVEKLLAAGADANASDGYGDRPLRIAIHRQHAKIIAMLRAAGARE